MKTKNEFEEPSPTNINESAPSVNKPDGESGSKVADIDTLSDNLIQGMPEVSEHVVEAHQQEQAEIENENNNSTDKRGDKFNPEIHATEEDGTPKFTNAGYFAKKRGRKTGDTKKSTIGGTEQKQNVDPQLKQKAAQAAAGSAAANSLVMLGIVLGGDEWRPIKNEQHGIDEKQNLESAFADYFTAKGMDDIPPGVALTIAVSGYMLPRFTMPKTQERTKTMFTRLKQWWANRKLKKHGLKAVPDDENKKDSKKDK